MDHCDGWMGRRLWATFQPSGLFEGAVEARVMINTEYTAPWYGHARAHDFGALVGRGLASQEDYERFLREQDTLSKRGHYFYSITGFAYVGQQMTDEMQFRGLSSRTQQRHLNAVCPQCKTSSFARCRRATVTVWPQAHGANRMVNREVLVFRYFRL